VKRCEGVSPVKPCHSQDCKCRSLFGSPGRFFAYHSEVIENWASRWGCRLTFVLLPIILD
jgi:DNA-binding transcriptional regulator LsrR (DeoR family)